ncbi:MAG: helix-hairpin-helix domain-containing protein [Thermoplasmata archaeon]
MRATRVLLVPLFGILVLASLAAATHLPDHRYHVHGSVVDDLGMPAMFVRVEVQDLTDPTVPVAVGSTGFGGGYDVLLHLHNHNVGDQVRVTLAGQSTVINALFDSNERTMERFSPSLPFTIPAGANIVPYLLIALAIAVPVVLVIRRYAPPLRGPRSRAKPGIDSIPGIGKAREKELRAVGINNLERLADAEATDIADRTSFSLKEAKRVVRRARALVEDGGPSA